jgi:hypothetical protein
VKDQQTLEDFDNFHVEVKVSPGLSICFVPADPPDYSDESGPMMMGAAIFEVGRMLETNPEEP